MTRPVLSPNTLPASMLGRTSEVEPSNRVSCDRTLQSSGVAAANTEDGTIPDQDIAAYMVDMLLELRGLAHKSGFDTLGRVLEIAESEAKLRVGSKR